MTTRKLHHATGAALAVLLLLGVAHNGMAQTGALAQKASEAAEISAIAQQNGYVRVIVMFNSPVAPGQLRPDAASVANAKVQVAAAQDGIVASNFGSASNPTEGQGFNRSLTRFPITPGFAVNVSLSELQALAADARVIRINYDRAVPPSLNDSVPLIGMTTAYTLNATGAGQAVAVLDTGVKSNHEFLSGKVVAEACSSNAGGFPNNVSLCPNGGFSQTGAGAANADTAACVNGSMNICTHGTHVAGIAAGLNTNQQAGEPLNGVAKGGKIFAIQVFTRKNSSTDCFPASAPCVTAFYTDLILALDHVFANINLGGGTVVASVNMSLGGGLFSGTCDSDPLKPSIDNLRSAGVLAVIAAGNAGSTSQIGAPGCISTAVTVGNTTKQDTVSPTSNMSSIVDVLAPGTSIQSSIPVVPSSNATTYDFLTGTSMAAPHVAGAVAAIRSACPSATANAIENALKSTGTPITDTRPGGTQTKPRIRVDLAVQSLGCGGQPPANDNFASAINLSGQSGSTSGTNVGATLQSGEPAPFSGTGTHTVWWEWTAPKSGEVTFDTIGSNFDTVLAAYAGTAVNALTLVAGNDDIDFNSGNLQSRITFQAQVGFTYYLRVDGFGPSDTGNITLNWSEPLTTSALVAAVLPYARSVQVGQQASAFGVIINTGGATATGCSVALPGGLPGSFVYQTTNASNQLVGSPNTPVSIGPGTAQNFVFGYTPSAVLNSLEIGMSFDCTNTPPVVSIPGVNTFILSASNTPTPDIVAQGATPSGDGIVNIPGTNATGFFATAGINIGTTATITAIPDDGGRGLPLTLSICQTNPSTGACLSPPAASTTTTFNNNATLTFTVFAQGNGNIPFDPANNRLFLRFKDTGGVTRGATNVAVRTFVSAPPPVSVATSP